LSPREKFGFKPTRLSRTRWVHRIDVEHGCFKMYGDTNFESDALTSISRNGHPQNVYFSDVDNDVPNMPRWLRIEIRKVMAKVHQKHQLANAPEGGLF
jgi:hypothetical protein